MIDHSEMLAVTDAVYVDFNGRALVNNSLLGTDDMNLIGLNGGSIVCVWSHDAGYSPLANDCESPEKG